MGTWSAKPFGNDAALDWIGRLGNTQDASLIDSTLANVLQTTVGVDVDDAQKAVAASAVVFAAGREPLARLPDEARAWIVKHGYVPSESSIRAAIAALDRVVRDSELLELWLESGEIRWKEEIDALMSGLSALVATVLPSRQPKSPPAPRILWKIIEATKPEDEGRSRIKLMEKLLALTDVNAPLPGLFLNRPTSFGCTPRSDPRGKNASRQGGRYQH